jgi:hypothetical protein
MKKKSKIEYFKGVPLLSQIFQEKIFFQGNLTL